jgi:hypothetical protein
VVATHGYTFLGTAVAIVTGDPADREWLDEFFTPAFERWSGAAADFAVRLSTTPDAARAVASARPQAPPAPADAFALDREIVALPSWRIPGGTVLDDPKFGAFYVLRGASVEVIAHLGSTRFRGGMMRVVREIATDRALASADRLQIHAAGLVLDGRAVVIAGPKEAGKTTLLTYIAASKAVRVLTNDRAILERTATGFRVHPMPAVVSVRPGTVRLFPEVFHVPAIPATASGAHLTLAETDAALAAHGCAGPDARLKLSPAQLARCLGRSLSGGAPLAAILCPEHDADPDGLAVVPLSRAEAQRRLDSARFGAHRVKTQPTVFEELTGARRPAGADDVLLDAVASGVACFGVRIGERRYADASAADAIVAAVAVARAGT